MFQGTEVPTEDQLKLLGVQIDSKLAFSAHLYKVSVRAQQ